MYGKGISRVGEVLDAALDAEIVSKSGAWFSYGDIRLGQGKENVKARLEEEQDLFNKIYDELKAKNAIGVAHTGDSTDEDVEADENFEDSEE